MKSDDQRIRDAVSNTEILRLPRQELATFGITNIAYYVVTEPVYSETAKKSSETVIRDGRVIAERPRIVTPYYMSQLEGFSGDARKYFEDMVNEYGANTPGLYYTYRNKPGNLKIVDGELRAVVDRLNKDIDERGDLLVTIIKGQDELWDISLMRFIYEITRSSIQGNISQLESRGLLDVDRAGVPMDARLRIEEMFVRLARGEIKPDELKDELERWNLFEEYQDRFLAMFKRRL